MTIKSPGGALSSVSCREQFLQKWETSTLGSACSRPCVRPDHCNLGHLIACILRFRVFSLACDPIICNLGHLIACILLLASDLINALPWQKTMPTFVIDSRCSLHYHLEGTLSAPENKRVLFIMGLLGRGEAWHKQARTASCSV